MGQALDGMAVAGRKLTRRSLLATVPGLAIIAATAGCGDDDDDPATQPPVTATTPAAATSTVPDATATSAPANTEESRSLEGSYPVVVEHKFGSTEIASQPERVLSLGYSDHDCILAFGVTPVAVRYWWGDESNAVFPWAIDDVDGPTPEVLNMPELDFEQIAVLDPDLIIAVYSGITAEEYATLSQIAPTVAQLDEYIDYGMPWEESTQLIGAALGQPELAQELIADVEARFAAARDANPAFDGATVAVAALGADGTVAFFAEQDGRSRILTSLGFQIPAEIAALFEDTFYVEISGEQMSVLDSADVIVWTQVAWYGREAVLEHPLYQQLNVAREGRHVFVEGTPDDAMQFNSVLSLPYLLESLVPQLAAAIDGDPETNAEPTT